MNCFKKKEKKKKYQLPINSQFESDSDQAYRKILEERHQNIQKHTAKLNELCQQFEESIDAQDLLKEKDIVQILGTTGIGKSSLLNYLNGAQFEIIESKNKIKSLEIRDKKFEISKMGNQHEALTKKVICFESNYKNKQLYFCDTPGFFDTDGFSGDLINIYATTNVIYNAKSIKFILMLTPEHYALQATRGRAFKDFIKQIVQMFQNFKSYSNAFLLVFNRINASGEAQEIGIAQQAIEEIGKILQDQNMKNFCELLIDKIKSKQYFIFDPQQSVKTLENDLDKIHSSSFQPLNKQQALDNIKISLNNESENEFINYLQQSIEFLKDCIKNNLSKQATDILISLNKLKEYIKMGVVAEKYNKVIEEIKNQEKMVELLQSKFRGFAGIENLDKTIFNNLIQEIRTTLNFYLVIEIFKEQTQEEINLLNNINKITLMIYDQMLQIVDKSLSSNSIEIKFLQVQKLKEICYNKDLSYDFQSLSQKLEKLKIPFLSDVFSASKYSLAQIEIESFCLQQSKNINQIIDNKEMNETIKLTLDNIRFIDSHQNENVNKHKLSYVNIVNKIKQQIIQFTQEIVNLKLQNPALITEEQMNKIFYTFKYIKFMCDPYNTGDHLQDLHRNSFSQCKESIKKELLQIYQDRNVTSLSQVNQQFKFNYVLSNIDDEIVQQAYQNNQSYFLFEQKIGQFLQQQKQNYEQEFLNNKNRINELLNNNMQQTVSDDILNNIKKNSIFLQQLSDCSHWSLKNVSILTDEYRKEHRNFFFDYLEGEVQNQISQKDKIINNFKMIQILIANLLGHCEYESEVYSYQLKNQQDLVDFLNQFQIWCRTLINLEQIQGIKNYNLTDFEKLNFQVLNIQNYLSFLQNFKKHITHPIEQIYSKIIERGEKLKQPEYNILQKDNNSQFDIISIIDEISQRINTTQLNISNMQNFVVIKFKQDYDFDLQNMSELTSKNYTEIKEILDQIKALYQSDYIYLNNAFQNNKYQEAQKIIAEYQEQRFNHIKRIADSQLTLKNQHLKQFEIDSQIISSHVNVKDVDIEKEKFKLTVVEKQVSQQLTIFFYEDKYKEASQFIQKLDNNQQNQLQQEVKKKIKQIIKSLLEYKEKFENNLTPELSQKIIYYFQIFGEIKMNFNNISQGYEEQIVTQIQLLNLKLIDNLFKSLETFNEEDQSDLVENKAQIGVMKKFFENLEREGKKYFSDKNGTNKIILNLSKEYERKMVITYMSVQNSMESKNNMKENVHQCIYVIIRMYQITEGLQQQHVQDNKQVKECFKLLKKRFNEQYALEQTKRFINSNSTFLPKEIERYMRQTFEKIWQFFIMNKKDIDQLVQNFIQQQDKTLQEIEKLAKNEEITKLLAFLSKNNDSVLIKNKIKIFFEEKQRITLIINIPQSNFKKVKQTLTMFKSFFSFYKCNSDKEMVEYIEAIFQNITKELLLLWDELGQKNINKPQQIQFTIELIEKLMMIIDCEIPQIQEKINLKNLIDLIEKSLDNKKNEIKSSIKKLNGGQTVQHFLDLKQVLGQRAPFMNQKRNYFKVYDKILRISYEERQINQQMYGKGISIIGQFEDFSEYFQDEIEKELSLLTSDFKNMYKDKKYDSIKEMSQKVQAFCQKINEQKKFLNKKHELIFIDLIVEQYEDAYSRAQQIQNSSQIKLVELAQLSQRLKEIEEHFKQFSGDIKQKFYSDQINPIFQKQIKLMIEQTENLIPNFINDQDAIKLFVQNLIDIFKCAQEIKLDSMDNNIEKLIQKATQNQEMDVVLHFLALINNDAFGNQIQEKYQNIFKLWFIELYNAKTAGQNNIDYVKNNLVTVQADKDIDFVKDELLKQYSYFKNIYDQINQDIISQKQDKLTLTSRIKQKSQNFKKSGNYLQDQYIIWSTEQKKQLLELLAEISALWSIIDMQESNSKSSRFIHTIQIITIMRLLNLDSEKQSQLYNHIAQVRTGEGKSIALGITSTIFALIGFEVDCCCYSQYLSERDFKDFESFFINFSVQKQIQYNTFFKLTEKIINGTQDLRTAFEKYISPQNSKSYQQNNQNQVKKVLIVDEIDFFFGEKFLGQVYAVGSQLKSEKVVSLMKLIWKKRFRGITIETIQKTSEYKSLFDSNQKLSQMKDFIDDKIKLMIQDARSMEKHSYLLDRIKNGAERVIAYQEIDGISYGTVKSYKTAFAYMQEWQRKKILTPQLSDHLSIHFNIGCFSYPKIIDCYSLVLGVTGTLQDMTKFQIDQMKKLCNIKKQTITPSIYGQSKFKFEEANDVFLYDDKLEHFQKILEQVQEMITKNRSVIVFFEDQQILFEFQKQCELNNVANLQILVEQTQNKKYVIAKAAQSNQVTLSTKPFGRGTDFKCFDKNLIKSGGIHIIQTFLSDSLAEQIQIQGRTARQGDPGSFSLILTLQNLKIKFNIQDGRIPNKSEIYQYLNTIRTQFQDTKDQELDRKQKEAEKYHHISMKLKDLLNQQYHDTYKINQLLKEISIYGDKQENRINKPSEALNQINDDEMKNAKKDKFGVAIDKKFDLAKDGSSNHLSILIGQFCVADSCDITKDIQNELKTALKEKGFKNFEIAENEKEFINKSIQFDQLWVICGHKLISKDQNIEKDFVDSILKHLKQRKGLFLLADNEPFVLHANLILKKIPIGYEEQTSVFMELKGNDNACNKLQKGHYSQKLQFGYHSITHGLLSLYEGNTICYPKILNNKDQDTYDDFLDLEIIGSSTTNRPCIFALNGNNKRGRIAFDCGFTKIMSEYWNETPGTSRYITNIYSWLYFLDKEEN